MDRAFRSGTIEKLYNNLPNHFELEIIPTLVAITIKGITYLAGLEKQTNHVFRQNASPGGNFIN